MSAIRFNEAFLALKVGQSCLLRALRAVEGHKRPKSVLLGLKLRHNGLKIPVTVAGGF